MQRNPETENETEVKKEWCMKRETVKQETAEKLIDCKYDRPSNKSHEIEKIRGVQRKPVSGNRTKLEVQLIEDEEFITPINCQKVKARQDSIPQRPNPKPPKTEHKSDRTLKPTVKKEVQNHMEIGNGNKKDRFTGHETPNMNAGLKNVSTPQVCVL